METIFINTENSKMNELHKFLLYLSQRLDLISSDKHIALQTLSIYYTWKNIRKQYKNNKLKMIVYQMVPILCQIFQTISNISLKSVKH